MEQDTLLHLKEKLADELEQLEKELASVGRPSGVTGGWEAALKEEDIDRSATEPDEKADRFEALEENAGIVAAVSARLSKVQRALTKIEGGTYGTCEVGGEEIEEERLEADPAARTCKKHLSEEDKLQQ